MRTGIRGIKKGWPQTYTAPRPGRCDQSAMKPKWCRCEQSVDLSRSSNQSCAEVAHCRRIQSSAKGRCFSLRDGDRLSVLIPDNDDLNIGPLAIVHKGDRGHVDRVGPDTPLLHEAPAQDDGEVAVLCQHDGARNCLASYLDGPLSEVGDTVETVGSRCRVLGDEAVVKRKASADVNVAVSRLEHHGNVLDGTDASLEQTNAELRVELLKGDLVRRNRRDGLVGLASLGGVGGYSVIVGGLGTRQSGRNRLAVSGSGSGLTSGRVHDRVSTTGGHSTSFAVVVGRRNVRCGNTVDANSAALATTRGAVDQGGLVHNGNVGTFVCAISRVLVGVVVVRDLGRFEVDCLEENNQEVSKPGRTRKSQSQLGARVLTVSLLLVAESLEEDLPVVS